jgi:hypothetical protein
LLGQPGFDQLSAAVGQTEVVALKTVGQVHTVETK